MNDKAAYVAEKLLGWEPTGCSSIWIDRGVDVRFCPYESADDDYRVLVAVREKWIEEKFDSFESEVNEVGMMHYRPGVYTDAAHAVLKGE